MRNGQFLSTALDRLLGEFSPHFDPQILLQDTVRTLSNLDFEHCYDMQRLERSKTDPTLKKQIANSLVLRHHTRREPYATLIAELRKRLPSAAVGDLKAAG